MNKRQLNKTKRALTKELKKDNPDLAYIRRLQKELSSPTVTNKKFD